MSIKVNEVIRDKDKTVHKVKIIYNGYIYIIFRQSENGPVEVARYTFNSILTEGKLWINKNDYRKIRKIVYAIFQKGGK